MFFKRRTVLSVKIRVISVISGSVISGKVLLFIFRRQGRQTQDRLQAGSKYPTVLSVKIRASRVISGQILTFNLGNLWQSGVPGEPAFGLLGWNFGDLGNHRHFFPKNLIRPFSVR